MSKSSMIGAVVAALAGLAALTAAKVVHAEPQYDLSNQKDVVSIEFECEKVGGLVFYNTGELRGTQIHAEYVDLINDTLYFTNAVKVKGEIVGDQILFDVSTLTVDGASHRCTAH